MHYGVTGEEFMDLMLFLQALAALAFVIGLMFVVFWLMKYCEVKSGSSLFLKKLKQSGRLDIVETRRIDAKNMLAVVQDKDDEYLLLLGSTQNLVLSTKKVKK